MKISMLIALLCQAGAATVAELVAIAATVHGTDRSIRFSDPLHACSACRKEWDDLLYHREVR